MKVKMKMKMERESWMKGVETWEVSEWAAQLKAEEVGLSPTIISPTDLKKVKERTNLANWKASTVVARIIRKERCRFSILSGFYALPM